MVSGGGGICKFDVTGKAGSHATHILISNRAPVVRSHADLVICFIIDTNTSVFDSNLYLRFSPVKYFNYVVGLGFL